MNNVIAEKVVGNVIRILIAIISVLVMFFAWFFLVALMILTSPYQEELLENLRVIGFSIICSIAFGTLFLVTTTSLDLFYSKLDKRALEKEEAAE